MITRVPEAQRDPGRLRGDVDCRLLPGQSPEEAEAALRLRSARRGLRARAIERQGGTRSPIGGPLWDAAEAFVAAEEPARALAPICVAGFTDSHRMREAFGTVAYGFFPSRGSTQRSPRA